MARYSRPMEIERRFLVQPGAGVGGAQRVERIDQGYLAIDHEGGTEVRIRSRAGTCTLTVKSATAGRARLEEELALDAEHYERLWPLTQGRRLEKDRHVISLPDGLTAELDVYAGSLAGLRIVEVEFADEGEADRFSVPDWFGLEVTDDSRYRNRELAVHGLPGR